MTASSSPSSKPIVITIDGPTASGKGTVAQRVADKLGFHYLDSGALYRLTALSVLRADIPLDDVEAVAKVAREEKEPTLAELLPRMQAADITLIEGFRNEPIPRLEVFRPTLGKAPMYADNHYVEAVASDAEKPEDLRTGIDWLDLNSPETIVQWLLGQ